MYYSFLRKAIDSCDNLLAAQLERGRQRAELLLWAVLKNYRPKHNEIYKIHQTQRNNGLKVLKLPSKVIFRG